MTAVIASTYAVITIFLGDFSYSWLQLRISESLTPLPYLFHGSAVFGLTVGCFLANLFSPVGMPDILFGPVLSFFAAFLSWKFNFGIKLVACIYPVIVNSFGVSLYLSVFYDIPYCISVLTMLISESIVTILIGLPLMVAIEKLFTVNLSEINDAVHTS